MHWLCRLHFHAGKWEYRTEGKCEQVFVCTRPGCGFTKERTEHIYNWSREPFDYESEEIGEAHGCPSTLSMVRVTGYVESCVCQRCGKQDSNTVEESRTYSDTIGVS